MKIDTESIAGYAEMSAEEKIAALEGYEMKTNENELLLEVERLKNALSKSNSEASDYKKQLRSKQSDDEAKAAQEAEEKAAMQKELDGLRKEKAIGDLKSRYLELGFDGDMALEAATALHSGDFETAFASYKKFLETTKQNAVADALKDQPGLTHGDPLNKQAADAVLAAQMRKDFGLPPTK